MNSSSLYVPSNWQNPAPPEKVVITFPGQPSTPQYSSSASGSNVALPPSQTLYAFDAEMEVAHEQRIEKTVHPVQTGASISDHAYIIPARLVLDVGMSDAIDAYYSPSTWSGSMSKSVSAYLTMLALQFSRIPLSISTRLRTYTSMIIVSLAPRDTYKTITGLRMRIEFEQIFVADVFQSTDSARPQETGTTNQGTVDPQTPTAAQTTQNAVGTDPTAAQNPPSPTTQPPPPQNSIPNPSYAGVVGSGFWSSVSTAISNDFKSLFGSSE